MSAWQFHRFFWKKDLLEAREFRLQEETTVPMVLMKTPPPDIEKVRIRGTFYNEHAVFVGPKRAAKSPFGAIMTPDSYTVFVPFITENNEHIMVNKGQVPSTILKDEKLRKDTLASWPIQAEFEAVYRKPEKVSVSQMCKREDGTYKKVHPGQMWHDFYEAYDIKGGARHPLGYWVDVVDQPFETNGNLPLTRSAQSYVAHIITPTVHAAYFATWSFLFAVAIYNLRRHGSRLFARGCENRRVLLGGVPTEQQMKW